MSQEPCDDHGVGPADGMGETVRHKYCVQFDRWDGGQRLMLDFESDAPVRDGAGLVLSEAWRALIIQYPRRRTADWHITRVWTLPDGLVWWRARERPIWS